MLLALSVTSDVLALAVRGRIRISGSFLALVLAMVFLGGTPAALIGVATILLGWLRWREPRHYLLNNLAHLRARSRWSGASPSTRVTRRGIDRR